MPYSRYKQLHIRLAKLAADSVTPDNVALESYPNPAIIDGRKLTAQERDFLIWHALDELHQFYINAKMQSQDALASLDRVIVSTFHPLQNSEFDGIVGGIGTQSFMDIHHPNVNYEEGFNVAEPGIDEPQKLQIKADGVLKNGQSLEGSSFANFLKTQMIAYNINFKPRQKKLPSIDGMSIFVEDLEQSKLQKRFVPIDNNQYSMNEAGLSAKAGRVDNVEFTFLSGKILYRPRTINMSIYTEIGGYDSVNWTANSKIQLHDRFPITSSTLTELGVNRLTRWVCPNDKILSNGLFATGQVVTLTAENLLTYIIPTPHFFHASFEDVGKRLPSLAGSNYYKAISVETHYDEIELISHSAKGFGFTENGERINGASEADLDIPMFYDNLIFNLCACRYYEMYERNMEASAKYRSLAEEEKKAFVARSLPSMITMNFDNNTR